MLGHRRYGDEKGRILAFFDGATAMSDPALERIAAYWEGLRDGAPMPARAAMDPRGLGDALGNAFLMERVAPGEVRLRVAGRVLCDLMGMEVHGMPLSALVADDARPALDAVIRQLFETPARVTLTLAGAGPAGGALSGEMRLWPLADRQGRATRALGGIATAGRAPPPPCRLVIRARDVRPIPGAAPTTAPAPDLAEPPAPFDHAAPRPRREGRPALRVIPGGRDDET